MREFSSKEGVTVKLATVAVIYGDCSVCFKFYSLILYLHVRPTAVETKVLKLLQYYPPVYGNLNLKCFFIN